MKRQRSTTTNTVPGVGTGTGRLQTTKGTTKKKAAKTRAGQDKEEVVKVGLGGNQMKSEDDFVAGGGGEMVMGWDEWPCSWAAVDEQMSWGTCWSPSWDMEFIDGETFHALYDDVVWEDDIWDLKDIKNVPSSSSSSSSQSLVH